MYKGWVPTVTGRLSFSSLGRSNHPTVAICANVADPHDRYIISYQKRPLLDAVLPAKDMLANLFFGLKGEFWFLCIAKSSNDVLVNGSLKGVVLIFEGSTSWRGEVEKVVKELQAKAEVYHRQDEVNSLKAYLDSDVKEAIEFLRKNSSFNIDFSLSRNGVCEIIVPTGLVTSKNAPTFPQGHEADFEHIVCSQIFFFMKDIAHIHQHHSPQTDTLIDIFRVDSNSNCSEDEIARAWMSDTLRLLYRKVLQFKRGQEEEIYSSSIGILAYIKSFIVIAEASGIKNLEPQLDKSNLEFSIRANQEKIRTRIQNDIKKSDAMRNTMIALIGLLVSFVGLTSLTKSKEMELVEPSSLYFDIAKFILEDPIVALSFLAFVYFGILIYKKVFDISKWNWVRGMIRLFQPFKQTTLSFLLLTAACLLTIATVYYIVNI